MCRLKGQESGLVHGVFFLFNDVSLFISGVSWCFIGKYGCFMLPSGFIHLQVDRNVQPKIDASTMMMSPISFFLVAP